MSRSKSDTVHVRAGCGVGRETDVAFMVQGIGCHWNRKSSGLLIHTSSSCIKCSFKVVGRIKFCRIVGNFTMKAE